MITIIIALLAFISTVLIVTTVHELGHYLVARLFKVKVLVFSLGFGKALFKFNSQANEWRISIIPFGGYVRFLDEREGEVAPEMQHLAYNRKPAYQKILIAIAGPLANVVLAVVLYYFISLSGVQELKPIIASIDSYNPLIQSLTHSTKQGNQTPSINAVRNNDVGSSSIGFTTGMKINRIDGTLITSWTGANKSFKHAVSNLGHKGGNISFEVTTNNNKDFNLDFTLTAKNLSENEPTNLESIGLFPVHYTPVISYVQADSPASIAGLKVGDQIISVDQIKINQWFDLINLLNNNTSHILQFKLKRYGKLINIPVYPLMKNINHHTVSKIGIMPSLDDSLLQKNIFVFYPNVLQAFEIALSNCYDIVALNVISFYHMAQGKLSVSNLGGPVMVAKVGGDALKSGLKSFFGFLALISVGIAFVNLLPIPILDGGHVVIYFIEWCIGREIDYKVQNAVFLIGVALILGISITTFYNDIFRIIHS